MTRLIAIALLLAAVLTGCGLEGRTTNSKWVDLPDGKGRVACAGASDGGIDCDWDHAERTGSK